MAYPRAVTLLQEAVESQYTRCIFFFRVLQYLGDQASFTYHKSIKVKNYDRLVLPYFMVLPTLGLRLPLGEQRGAETAIHRDGQVPIGEEVQVEVESRLEVVVEELVQLLLAEAVVVGGVQYPVLEVAIPLEFGGYQDIPVVPGFPGPPSPGGLLVEHPGDVLPHDVEKGGEELAGIRGGDRKY